MPDSFASIDSNVEKDSRILYGSNRASLLFNAIRQLKILWELCLRLYCFLETRNGAHLD